MKAGRKRQLLTEKESIIMQMLWNNGAMFVREMLEIYPETKPHVNTVSTTVRILEEKGYVAHEVTDGGSYRYFATAEIGEFRRRSLSEVIKSYFNNSYASAVSALVEEEKISVEELREIINMVENQKTEKS